MTMAKPVRDGVFNTSAIRSLPVNVIGPCNSETKSLRCGLAKTTCGSVIQTTSASAVGADISAGTSTGSVSAGFTGITTGCCVFEPAVAGEVGAGCALCALAADSVFVGLVLGAALIVLSGTGNVAAACEDPDADSSPGAEGTTGAGVVRVAVVVEEAVDCIFLVFGAGSTDS
jgi:hypothetical protein